MCLLDILKNDFAEVDKAMIPGVESPTRSHILHPGLQKSDL
jgi:hypothetical protein